MGETEFDAAIVGGGLGGLSLSILLARQGWRVALFEKERYPFHRVCGEYISNESRDFVTSLGVDLHSLGAVDIFRLSVNSPKGKALHAPLGLGGFGISRYTLDHALAQIARAEGVALFESARVEGVTFEKDRFEIASRIGRFQSRLLVGAYGKKSKLDLQLQRHFTRQKPHPANNFIGVKYHVTHPDFPSDLIELSNFKDGYCGMSRVEGDRYCLCYLTTAQNLRDHGNSIASLEENVLMRNPILADRLGRSTRLFEAPVVISQINFQTKSAVEDHILMLGDGAGTIAPLCGNGMSMAFHAAWTLSGMAGAFLAGKVRREAVEADYERFWNRQFRARIKAGFRLQKLFGRAALTEMSIGTLRHLPFAVRRLIRLTHGRPFFHASSPE